MATKNNLVLLAVGALAFMYLKPGSARVTQNVPGATPVLAPFNKSGAYAARGIQQTSAQPDVWGTLGGALGTLFNKAINSPSPAASNGISAPDVSVGVMPDTSYPASADVSVYQAAPGTVSTYFDSYSATNA